MGRRARWHDRRNGSSSYSALRPVQTSSASPRKRPWNGLSDESKKSRAGPRVSASRRQSKNWPRYAVLDRLFRLLRNARSAPHSLGPVATPGRSMVATEDTTSSSCGADRAGGERAAGEQYRRQRSWSLASCQEQGSLSRPQQQVFQLARSPISIWHVLAKLLKPPPYAGRCGRAASRGAPLSRSPLTQPDIDR